MLDRCFPLSFLEEEDIAFSQCQQDSGPQPGWVGAHSDKATVNVDQTVSASRRALSPPGLRAVQGPRMPFEMVMCFGEGQRDWAPLIEDALHAPRGLPGRACRVWGFKEATSILLVALLEVIFGIFGISA